MLAPDSKPGHIVRLHLLTILNEAEFTSVTVTDKKFVKNKEKQELGQ